MMLSLRGRFALLAGLLVLAVASLAALGGYLAMRASLLDRTGRTAGAQARQLAALVDVPSANGAAEPSGPTASHATQPASQANRVDITDLTLTHELAMSGTLIEVIRPNGAPIQTSSAARSRPSGCPASSPRGACGRARQPRAS
jgi:hypothetical protein